MRLSDLFFLREEGEKPEEGAVEEENGYLRCPKIGLSALPRDAFDLLSSAPLDWFSRALSTKKKATQINTCKELETVRFYEFHWSLSEHTMSINLRG